MAKLFTKEEKFFHMFAQMSLLILEAAQALKQMLEEPAGDMQSSATRIKDLEHKGDELTTA